MDTEMNPIFPATIVLAIIVLVFWMIRRNRRDKKDLTDTLNDDYKKTPDKEQDLDDAEK